MLILNVVTETPLWVWILFFFLVGIGINALRDREISIRGLFIMPLFFLLWGGISVIDELTFSYWGLVAMSVGGLLGYGTGWWLSSSGLQLKRKEGINLIIWPGSRWLIVFVIITFITKYTLNVILSIEPELMSSWRFNVIFGVLSGFISGLLWGRTLNLYLTYRQANLCG